MEAKSWSQQDVANAAGVKQSAVSRMLKDPPSRIGRSQQRILALLDANGYSAPGNLYEKRVVEAFNGVWDRSPEHADALIAVITGLPILRLKETDKDGLAGS
jgi:transcriptional regulator with XRE-family HTH domain